MKIKKVPTLADGAIGACSQCHLRGRVESCNRPEGAYVVYIHFGLMDAHGLLIKKACWIKVHEDSRNSSDSTHVAKTGVAQIHRADGKE